MKFKIYKVNFMKKIYMKIYSKNPYTGESIGEYETLSSDELKDRLRNASMAANSWKEVALDVRCELIRKAGQVLRNNIDRYARMITDEMGKPISESRSEIEKCAWVCDYYAENAKVFLQDKNIETDATKSLVRYDPLGVVYAVMPWNFPFWQVFRFAAPTLTAGNAGLLKHASNVTGCSQLIEEVFKEAGYPEAVFQSLIVDHELSEEIISSQYVQAVTLTGSEGAGSIVASQAGKQLKKTVLELGGSNSFVVCEDADLEKVVQTAVQARMQNCGQSCIAAKRFILIGSMYEEFIPRFINELKKLKTGNPLLDETDIGPMAREDLAETLEKQMNKSIEKGAVILHGGKRKECFFDPTVIAEVQPGMPAFDEETFGPLASMIKATSLEHALELSEMSKFGLGVTICTQDENVAMDFAGRVSDGACFVNELVKSDPRLPFGGTKKSGYGRELSKDGIMEFVNRKTVYFK